MEQNIATSKGCCPSIDRSGNREELLETNWTGQRDVVVCEGPVGPVPCEIGTETRLARVSVKVQVWGGGLFVLIKKATTIPGREENSPPQEVLVEGVIQSKVMGRMVSFAEDIQHAA